MNKTVKPGNNPTHRFPVNKIEKEEFDPVVEPTTDKVHRIARSILSAVPAVGGALTESLNTIIAPPYETRVNNWLYNLSDTINDLIDNHSKTESELRENKALLSAILRSSDIAVRTSSEDVINALSNGLISVALDQTLEESLVCIYLNSIARLTSLHLKLLEYLASLSEVDKSIQLTQERQLEFFKNLAGYDNDLKSRELVYRLMNDLMNERVVALPEGASASSGGPNFINMRLTMFGEELIRYISGRKV
ncbi:hypothetical protein Mag101_11935 [Microbulbifer agarilyticus]|uniref:Uncharacterized protein n=1 Tax=Microbulbifer agarilyticus TaxID=260552 RepID=A0A1Q2M6A1_9GAMM|nr:hypothetical protein [Microbulbifer agarilyticus]AQQ68273.1 hypothetical protein Mag101_11935 [Microbulbifer agarilyticus]